MTGIIRLAAVSVSLSVSVLIAVSALTITPSAQAVSVYSDVSLTYLNKKVVQNHYLTNIGYGAGGGLSVGLINLIEVDAHYSVNIFDNSKFQSRVAVNVPVNSRGQVLNPNYGTLEEILSKRATISAAEFSILLAPPLVIIKPYAAAGVSYSTVTVMQVGKLAFKDNVVAPMLKMGARANYLFAFVGIEYKSNTARFDIDLNYDGQKTPLILGGDSFVVSFGISI